FLFLSIPNNRSMKYLESELCMTQLERGAVELAILAKSSDLDRTLFARSCPYFSTSFSLTLAIIIGMSISAGQISLHRPQEMQRCANSAFSSPWISSVQGMPMGPG